MGRKRIYENNAERQAAYRDRKKNDEISLLINKQKEILETRKSLKYVKTTIPFDFGSLKKPLPKKKYMEVPHHHTFHHWVLDSAGEYGIALLIEKYFDDLSIWKNGHYINYGEAQHYGLTRFYNVDFYNAQLKIIIDYLGVGGKDYDGRYDDLKPKMEDHGWVVYLIEARDNTVIWDKVDDKIRSLAQNSKNL